jgi:heme exporter protein CcmB
MSVLAQAGRIAWKDLTIEWRTREIVYTMIFFAAVIVLVFSFAFVSPGGEGPSGGLLGITPGGKPDGLPREIPANVAGGILWIAVTLAGTLGLSRAFDREREHGTMRALLLSPASRSAIFLGKALGIVIFMVAVVVIVTPLAALMFGAPIAAAPGELALLLVLASIGFATAGVVFAAMLMRSRAREMLLPVMLYPVIIPALIAGVKGTAALWMDPPELAVAHFWLKFLAVFDVIFIMVALWAFESLVVE